MIANRPEKICPATKTITNTRKVRENRKYVEKTDVVVRHIIGYKPAVMEKIKSNKSSGFRTEVQYVVENWDRVGEINWFNMSNAFSLDAGLPFFGGFMSACNMLFSFIAQASPFLL